MLEPDPSELFTPLCEKINPGHWVDIYSPDIDLEEYDIKHYHNNTISIKIFDQSSLPNASTFNQYENKLLIIRTSDPSLWVIVYFAENGPIFFNPNFDDIRSFENIYNFVSVLDQRQMYQIPFPLMSNGATTSGYYCLWAVGVLEHISHISYFDKIIKNTFKPNTLENDYFVTDIV